MELMFGNGIWLQKQRRIKKILKNMPFLQVELDFWNPNRRTVPNIYRVLFIEYIVQPNDAKHFNCEQ